ncbi:MAG: hypothetical protein J6S70_00125 [Clostridia bacterium]|nr:hypothetical protein [Clostridia bacterium]
MIAAIYVAQRTQEAKKDWHKYEADYVEAEIMRTAYKGLNRVIVSGLTRPEIKEILTENGSKIHDYTPDADPYTLEISW